MKKTVPHNLLMSDEKVILALGPSKLIMLPSIIKWIFVVSLMPFLYAEFAFSPGDKGATLGFLIMFFQIGLLGSPILLIFWLQWKNRLYVLTDKRIITREGVIAKKSTDLPIKKIQNTYVKISILQRILGVGNIEFSTAGRSGIETKWIWVRDPQEIYKELHKYFE